jgi:hypothetical protein
VEEQPEPRESERLQQKPQKTRALTVTEFAQEVVARVETVQAMIEDGLVKTCQRTGKWRGGE